VFGISLGGIGYLSYKDKVKEWDFRENFRGMIAG